ncbi:flippase [Robbsia sp. Bb-Pol-6]|uniref:Flippase n=1 Tax=Robbsia betulipollinis TaxID=2981849 RepID=A0ABT3ZT84_9BURK|nr:flippase [Robbsia betulipollinis]MCY0389789.1 flippase [Robbsia betulipollinis]
MSDTSSLKRNGLYNFLGSTLPIFVSLVTIPLYLSHVGAAAYGVLSIVWMLQGYFGFFDFGLTRATANQVAKLKHGTADDRESIFWTALILNTCSGLIGGIVLYLVGALAIEHFVQAQDALRNEVLRSMPWIAASVPITTISGVLVGSVEGREKFGVLNAVQLVNMFIFQTFPLLASYAIGPSLNVIIPASIIGGCISIIVLAITAFFCFPLRMTGKPKRKLVKVLFSYGVWISISNFILPIMEAADRFIISRFLGAVAVAQYNVPFNLSIRVRIIPSVISRTIFPRMSAQDSKTSLDFFEKATKLLAAVLTPVIVLGIFAMGPFIHFWINPTFAIQAGPIGCILLLGIWFNSLAFIPVAYLQAQARPGVVARLQLWQVIPFLTVLWFSIHHFGLLGAAWAWTARVAIDAVLLTNAVDQGIKFMKFCVFPITILIVSYVVNELLVTSVASAAAIGAPFVLVCAVWAYRTEPRIQEIVKNSVYSRKMKNLDKMNG